MFTIIVSGKLGHRGTDASALVESLSRVLAMNQHVKVIYSGPSKWEKEYRLPIKLITQPKSTICKHPLAKCSVCLQRDQAEAALSSLARSDFCVRLRTDFVVDDPAKFIKAVSKAKKNCESRRIALLAEGGRNPLKVPQPFFLSDWTQMGTAETLRQYYLEAPCLSNFDGPSENFWSRTLNFGREFDIAPEQVFAVNFLRQKTNGLKISHHPTLRNFLIFFGEAHKHVCLLSQSSLGLKTGNIVRDKTLARYQMDDSLVVPASLLRIIVNSLISTVMANILFFINPIWIGMRGVRNR